MDGKMSIVDKAAIYGRTYTARCKAAILFVRRVSAVSEKMKKMSSP